MAYPKTREAFIAKTKAKAKFKKAAEKTQKMLDRAKATAAKEKVRLKVYNAGKNR